MALKSLVGIALLVIGLQIVSWGLVGGYASGGKVISGHYYVNNKGRLVEVSRNAFLYSLWLGYAGDAAMLVALLSGAAANADDRKAKREREAAALSRINLN